MPVIDHDELRRIGRRVFAAAGSDEAEAAIVADHLVEANLKGHDSHGVGMIPSYLRNLGNGKAATNEKGHVVSDSGSMIVYDGARGWGQIVAREATLRGIAKAKETGVAVVALRNAHHIGRVGTYGEMCAGEGLVSISFVNITDQRPAVAPWRGGDARFGTNPVTIALPGPAADRPIIADMATSRIAMGKVRVARNKGEQIAADTLLGPEGQPTGDPNVMYRRPRGALLTFAEHKGYALAFICEMLAGAVTGSGTMRPERQDAESVTNGMLLIVIDPSRLVDRAWLVDEVRAMADYITASPPRRSGEPVLIPGDPERLMRAKRIAEGVPVDDETWREIVEAARGVNVLVEAPKG
ncbi:MAG TPA: malate/lactate/ureidoglycolate dehydrogenase [Stellaceae bacterium]|nr:malate/lactate/ureidoglycolate dehydrogenase [Stellaceae bacterium]